jgi:8-oxo-dGTP diphosphatase
VNLNNKLKTMNIPTGLKKNAAMVVLRHKDQLLLLKRAKPPHVGKYLPVGGKLEPFEDPYSAALRETEEETGIRLESLHFSGILIETSPTAYNWQCSIYVADIDYCPPPGCDEGELAWIPYKDVFTIPTPATDRHVYIYITQNKPFVFNAIYNEQMVLTRMTEEIENKEMKV